MFNKFTRYLQENTSLSQAAIKLIEKQFTLQLTRKKEILLDSSEVCRNFYFINSGILRIFTITADGTEITRFFAFDNMFFTALPSFIDQKPAGEYLQSLENCELLSCRRSDFYKIISDYPEMDHLYRKILELGFITSQKRIYSFQGMNTLEKMKWIRQNQPLLLKSISNKLLASYIGVSPSTLSRLKTQL